MIGPDKLVTAAVVVYNGEKYLRDCLQSIVDQNYEPLEILVVDDGSTDNSPAIIKSFGDRIRCFRQENTGEAAARNKSIELAKGDYIAFLDADDLWCPDKVSTQVQVFEKYPQYDVVFGQFKRIDDSFRYKSQKNQTIQPIKPEIDHNWSGWLYPRMLLDSWVHIITAMVKKEVFKGIGQFNTDNIIGTDYDFWIRVSKKHQMAKIPFPLALYRDNPASATAKFTERNYGAEIVEKYSKKYGISDPHGGRITKSQLRKRLYQQWFSHGYIARNHKRYRHAIRSFLNALQYAPFDYRTYINLLYAVYKIGGGACRKNFVNIK